LKETEGAGSADLNLDERVGAVDSDVVSAVFVDVLEQLA
jgi:hypothetical protein